jgi:putative membrane protein
VIRSDGIRTATRTELVGLATACGVVFAWSAISPTDRLTWVMEVLPAVIALVLLMATRARYPLTRIAYWLIALHAVVLIVGGRYTYAHVPFGFWLQDVFGFSRNPYDRIGHFMQGFVPAIVTREILLRSTPLVRGAMTFFLVCCVCLAVSAFYEFIEWWAALALGQGASEFLGTQGDPWDTQWDMFLALVGATVAQLVLGRLHDRELGIGPSGGNAPAGMG